jgi:hypothetical protein
MEPGWCPHSLLSWFLRFINNAIVSNLLVLEGGQGAEVLLLAISSRMPCWQWVQQGKARAWPGGPLAPSSWAPERDSISPVPLSARHIPKQYWALKTAQKEVIAHVVWASAFQRAALQDKHGNMQPNTWWALFVCVFFFFFYFLVILGFELRAGAVPLELLLQLMCVFSSSRGRGHL